MKRFFCLLLLTQLALAHNFWLKPEGKKATLFYGHGSEEIVYSKQVVKKVAALGADGKVARVRWEMDGKHAVLAGEGEVAQLGAEIDEGYWCKTPEGWKNKSKKDAPDALASEWSLSYSKVLLKPQDCLNRTFGHKLELVPIALDGKRLRLRLLLDGKALPGVPISDGHKKSGETDEGGELTVPYEGAVVYSALGKDTLENNPNADKYKLRAVLSLP